MPLALLDVMSDGINSWDQMGFDASQTLIYVWLDPIIGSICYNIGEGNDTIEDGNLESREGIRNCTGYYANLKSR